MMDMVSIIVPIYKVEKYLRKCLDSILSQTYHNLDIILVEDGSPDDCAVICEDYAARDRRIRVIHKTNGGLSSARNVGLELAKGEYICFVDSDDYIKSDMIEKMLSTSLHYQSDLVMCDFYKVYEGEEASICESSLSDYSVYKLQRSEAQQNSFLPSENRIAYVVAWNKLYKKQLFEGIRYPENKIHEDEAVTYRLLYQARNLVHIKLPLYYYLVNRTDSIMRESNLRKHFHLFDAYLNRIQFYYLAREDALCNRMILHYMHMLCHFIKLGGEKQEYKKETNHYYFLLKEFINKKISFSFLQKIEVFLYKNLQVYYTVWSIKNLLIRHSVTE